MASPSPRESHSEAAAPGLKLFLFGPPRVELAGRPLVIKRRQARALLYRLAAEDQPVPREILCFMFWPDSRENIARCNLSRLITILHQALPVPDPLIARDDQVSLDQRLIATDAGSCRTLWDEWKAGGGVAPLRQAMALCEQPFLAGFSLPGSSEFDTWLTLEREHWNRLAVEGLTALMDDHLAGDDYQPAIEYARRCLALNELDEDVQRRLIDLYHRAGDRSAALRQYERCVITLQRELGVDPLPETQALYQAIRLGQRTKVAPATVLAAARPPPLSDVPLVGRETELRLLHDALDGSRRHCQTRVVLIAGEAGIGKTRLMQEFMRLAGAHALTLTGACYPETQAVPYRPIVQALRSRLTPASLTFKARPPWLAEAARLFPELAQQFPGQPPPPPGEPGWARGQLFEALGRLLATMAGDKRPVLLCLDDLQWADSVTLDWLAYLTHHEQPHPLLIVAAFRDEEPGRFSGLTAAPSRQGLLTSMALHGLSESAVQQLLRHLAAGALPDETRAGRLRQVTGGNPFFLLEMLRAQPAATGPIAGDELLVPESVSLVVQSRLQQLSGIARQMMESAAVLGHRFTFDEVSRTAGRPQNEAVEGLDEAVADQLLREEAGGYHFRHGIVREVIYQALTVHRRRLLHRRAANALEKLPVADAAALARHLERGDEPGRAARYALQAGRAAKKVFAHVEARAWFEHALELLALEAASLSEPAALQANQRTRLEALSERGWALRLVGDMDDLAVDLEEELGLAERLRDPGALSRVRQNQAYAHLWFCRFDEARQAAAEGLRLSLADGDIFVEAMCRRAQGLAARAVGDYEQGESALKQALERFDALKQADLQVHVLGNLSTLYYYRGDYAQALQAARQALALGDAAGLPQDRRLALGDLGAAALALGDWPLARQSLTESLQLARQVNDRTQEIFCLGHLGRLAINAGRAEEALDKLQAALSLAESIDSRAELSWLHAGLAEAWMLLGRLDTALTHLWQAEALAAANGLAYERRLAQQVAGRLAVRLAS